MSGGTWTDIRVLQVSPACIGVNLWHIAETWRGFAPITKEWHCWKPVTFEMACQMDVRAHGPAALAQGLHWWVQICWQACQHSGCNSVSILNQISMADMAVQVDEVSSRSYQEAGKLQRPSRLTETQLQAVAALKSAARAGWMENVCDARNITGAPLGISKESSGLLAAVDSAFRTV